MTIFINRYKSKISRITICFFSFRDIFGFNINPNFNG